MQDLLQDNKLFKVLFDVIPALTMIINHEGRVISINDALQNFLRIPRETVSFRKAGDVLGCITARVVPGECGLMSACENCVLRKTGMQAVNNQTVSRARGKLEIDSGGERKTIHFLASSAPLKYAGNDLAVVLVEDISDVIYLKGLISICSGCGKVRDDDGYWSRLETYIENSSDARFSHDVCPECLRRLYPEYFLK